MWRLRTGNYRQAELKESEIYSTESRDHCPDCLGDKSEKFITDKIITLLYFKNDKKLDLTFDGIYFETTEKLLSISQIEKLKKAYYPYDEKELFNIFYNMKNEMPQL